MQFPLTFWDLSIWMAVMTVILLVTSELLSAGYGRISIFIDRSRLREFSFAFGVISLCSTVLWSIYFFF